VKKKILILGEQCVDIFHYGRATRLAPDGPFPVFSTEYTKSNAGMAGNLFENFISLRPDWEVYILFNLNEITKTRYVDITSNYTLLRIDKGDKIETQLTEEMINQNFELNHLTIKDFQAIIFCDYDKGFLTQELISSVTMQANMSAIPTFMDTKKILGPWSRDITYVKINEKEFNTQLNHKVDLKEACINLIVTLGGKGSLYWNDKTLVKAPETAVIDLSGAGDTYFAAFISHLIDNDFQTIPAMNYANLAAGISVSKRGVVKITTEEIDHTYNDKK